MKIKDFAPLIEEIISLEPGALVVFDVDETLIVAKDKVLRPCGEKHLMALSKKMGTRLSAEERDELQSLTLLKRKICHTDPQLPYLFATMKKHNIGSIALTAIPTGKFGCIPAMEKWRDEELKRYGIDFADHSPCKYSLYFEEFGAMAPTFYQGLLCSSTHSKGASLKAFLQKTQMRPSRVIFVDDRDSHLAIVEEELKSMDIDYRGFHYIGASCPTESVNEEIANLQFDFLIRKKMWLSDEEAVHLLYG